MFPLIKLAKKLKGGMISQFKNPTSTFPLIKLAKKLKVEELFKLCKKLERFPLIKLAKKLKDDAGEVKKEFKIVSIN